MTDRTFNPAQRPTSKTATHITGIAWPRPVTKLRTVDEAAELLNISKRTAQRLIVSGALPVHRFGRLVRVSDADIAAFLAATRSF